MTRRIKECKEHDYKWSRYCGAMVCSKCDQHKGLHHCYCGWNLTEEDRIEFANEES